MNETTRQLIVHKVKHNTKRLITSIKWVIFSIVVGIVAGSCGTAFYFALSVVTDFRMKYPWLIYFLPIGGLAIVGLYHLCKDDNDTGTNLVISAIHSGDKVPFKMAPLYLYPHLSLTCSVALPAVRVLLCRWEAASEAL